MIRKLVFHWLRNICVISTTLCYFTENGQTNMFSFSEEITSMKIPLFTKLIVCSDIFWTLELVLHDLLIKKVMLYRLIQAYCITWIKNCLTGRPTKTVAKGNCSQMDMLPLEVCRNWWQAIVPCNVFFCWKNCGWEKMGRMVIKEEGRTVVQNNLDCIVK